MDVYSDVFLNLWHHLNNNGVRYIMVGGFATNLHGFQRYTGDIDILLEDTPFLYINHLIENKRVVNRPKDQIDVIELEKIRAIREKQRDNRL